MSLEDVGIVLIAKNEGERLLRSIESCLGRAGVVVYADSASTDGSAERAREAGAEVTVLDVSERPPNQPRGRNAGFRRLMELRPDVRYVFFMDGDCQLVEGFLEAGREALEADPKLGAVCGRRRELAPEASVYNRLIDMEWNTPVEGTQEFGGDALIRVQAFQEAGGYYEESMISGEDFELSHRIRRAGWGIRRLPLDMALHDVAIHRFGPWWARHARGGYAYAHGCALHRRGVEGFHRARVWSILAHGLGLPLLALGAAPWTAGLSLLLLLNFPYLALRLASWRRSIGDPAGHAWLYGLFVSFGKLAEAQGVLRCWKGLALGGGFVYRDYKDYQRGSGETSGEDAEQRAA